MTTIIEQIRAEIKRLEGVDYPCDTSEQATGFYDALDRISRFLDTLQEQERPEPYNPTYDEAYLNEKIKKATESWKGIDVNKMLAESRGYDEPEVDLEEEADRMFFSLGWYEGDHHQPMLDCVSLEQFRDIARHFFILGIKATCNTPMKQITLNELATEGISDDDLEVRKQIEELANDWHHKGFASDEDCPLCMQDLMDILWHFYELGKHSKEPVSEDLEKEIESMWNKASGFQPKFVTLEVKREGFGVIARHFYNLGKNSK